MSDPLKFEIEVHFERQPRGGKVLNRGPQPEPPPNPGRVPKVTRYMALAIRFQELLARGEIESYAEIARLGQVTRARVSQIMGLLNLAPDLQEQLLNLPRVTKGRDPVILQELQEIANTLNWCSQRKMWEELIGM